VGCWNRTASPATFYADVYNPSGQLIQTVTMSVPGEAWSQATVTANVTNGYIKWRTDAVLGYAYAVVVDNKSNDGSFAPAIDYIP
jgi:hypothetical protein